ncbi:hypothetical protein SUGI_1487940 [Cryptomeria japonica]|uniref:Uncharacterized protein n=1 Tax=Cryptomeria japonica TaxID=3369 RepID=A0AAD3NNJ0_CRYJA|nr:hypothetical protein SUGI_1487940 [Cryptomeria japonica]
MAGYSGLVRSFRADLFNNLVGLWVEKRVKARTLSDLSFPAKGTCLNAYRLLRGGNARNKLFRLTLPLLDSECWDTALVSSISKGKSPPNGSFNDPSRYYICNKNGWLTALNLKVLSIS